MAMPVAHITTSMRGLEGVRKDGDLITETMQGPGGGSVVTRQSVPRGTERNSARNPKGLDGEVVISSCNAEGDCRCTGSGCGCAKVYSANQPSVSQEGSSRRGSLHIGGQGLLRPGDKVRVGLREFDPIERDILLTDEEDGRVRVRVFYHGRMIADGTHARDSVRFVPRDQSGAIPLADVFETEEFDQPFDFSVFRSGAEAVLPCVRDNQPDQYEAAATRWIARYCSEHEDVTLAFLDAVVDVFRDFLQELQRDPDASRDGLERLLAALPRES